MDLLISEFLAVSACLSVGGIFQADRALQRQPKLSIIYTALSAVEELVHAGVCTYTNIHTITRYERESEAGRGGRKKEGV